MNKTLKAFQYQILDSWIPLAIFYSVLMLLSILIGFGSNNNTSISGYEFASVIFIFIAGLNCFKTSFKFLQFFQVSRKTFYLSSILTLLTIAAGMTIVDTVFGKLFALVLPYQTLYATVYGSSGIFYPVVWEFALLMMAAVVGWFITLLYYRSNKILKIVISLSPIYVTLLFRLTGPSEDIILKVLAFFFGFMRDVSSWMNVLGMTITVLIVLGLNFLLIRRAPVKS